MLKFNISDGLGGGRAEGCFSAKGRNCENRVENRRFCTAVFVDKKLQTINFLC